MLEIGTNTRSFTTQLKFYLSSRHLSAKKVSVHIFTPALKFLCPFCKKIT